MSQLNKTFSRTHLLVTMYALLIQALPVLQASLTHATHFSRVSDTKICSLVAPSSEPIRAFPLPHDEVQAASYGSQGTRTSPTSSRGLSQPTHNILCTINLFQVLIYMISLASVLLFMLFPTRAKLSRLSSSSHQVYFCISFRTWLYEVLSRKTGTQKILVAWLAESMNKERTSSQQQRRYPDVIIWSQLFFKFF